MATNYVLSGSIQTKEWHGSSGDPVYVVMNWSAKQDIIKNTSTISWDLKCKREGSDRRVGIGYLDVVVDGNTVHSTGPGTNQLYRNGDVIASGSRTVTHDGSGNKKLNISFSCSVYVQTEKNRSASGVFDLKTIPRYAKPVSVGDFTDEQNPTLVYSNPAGSSISGLKVQVILDGSVLKSENLDANGTKRTISLTEDMRTRIRNACPTNSRNIEFKVLSTIGGKTEGHSVNGKVSIVNANPTFNPSVKDTDPTTIALTGDEWTIVKYFSNAHSVSGARALKGATIVEQTVTNNGITKSGDTADFTDVQSRIYTYYCKDSRGNTTTQTLNKHTIEYVKPTCAIDTSVSMSGDISHLSTNPQDDGIDPAAIANTVTVSADIHGMYFNNKFGSSPSAKQNKIEVLCRYQAVGEAWSPSKSVPATFIGNSYNAHIAFEGLDYTKTYRIEAVVSDSLSSAKAVSDDIKALPIFDIGENDVNFNVPVRFSDGMYVRPAHLLDIKNPPDGKPIEKGGKINLPGANKYQFFVFIPGDKNARWGTPILAWKTYDAVRGIGGNVKSNGTTQVMSASFNISGNTWELVNARFVDVTNSGSTAAPRDVGIYHIYGIL